MFGSFRSVVSRSSGPLLNSGKAVRVVASRLCQTRGISSNSNDVVEVRSGRPKNDPVAAAFFSPAVQMSLAQLTGIDYQRVFRVARRGQQIKPPTYVFMTDEELSEAKKKADQRAKQKWLQMPPVMSPRSQDVNILDVDPAIQGYDSAKYVFTDITYNIHDRARLIVVREPDGTLREASGHERDRLNQIYFPKHERKVNTPILFKEDVMKECLELGGDRYIYVLDRNCVQFEPDNPKFIQTAETVYNTIDERGDYKILKSTRFYGPMIFYLVWNKRCDNYIIHELLKEDIEDVFETVHLYALLHPDSKVASQYSDSSSESSSSSSDEESGETFESKLEKLKLYIAEDSKSQSKLRATLESYLERRADKIRTDQGISKAHGSKK